MTPDLSSDTTDAGPLSRKEALRRSCRKAAGQAGNVLFYIFIAIALLGALTFSFAKDGRQNVTTQMGHKTSEELFIQASVIRAAIIECAVQYPQGGGDITGDGQITTADNFNPPYPVQPSHPNNPHGVQPFNNNVRVLSCTGAPAAEANIFQGANNKGRFLPPPPAGFNEWVYRNDANGVRIEISAAGGSAIATDSLARLTSKFATCQSDINYGGCGASCISIWIQRNSCP